MSYHNVTVVGNLGADVEKRYLPSGSPVANFSLAANRSYKDKEGQRHTETVWFRVTVWGKTADTLGQYIGRGSRVLVVGRLTPNEDGNPRVWQRKDGTHTASFDLTAETVRFLDSPSERESSEPQEEAYDPNWDNEQVPF